MTDHPCTLVLRLAGPLQSWGVTSQFRRRETQPVPTKSGVIGLLAAADGRRREDPIVDLVGLRLGIRVDQGGTLLQDYHTVSDYRGGGLLTAATDARGRQGRNPKKPTEVTRRYYLQDAVFVAAVEGDPVLLAGLASALLRPAYPLALGRRSCVPTMPLLINSTSGDQLWQLPADEVLRRVPWQAGVARQRAATADRIDLPIVVDASDGSDVVADVPVSFSPRQRGFLTRRVEHDWVSIPTDGTSGAGDGETARHDPFALLGWW